MLRGMGMKKIIRIVVMVFLTGITAASVYMYTVSEQEKNTLMNLLKQTEMQVEALETDKQILTNDKQALLLEVSAKNEVQQSLLQKKEELEKELQACEEKFAEFDANTQNAQKTIDQLDADIGSLKTEIASLKTENAYLKTTNNSLNNENASLRAENTALKAEKESAETLPVPAKK